MAIQLYKYNRLNKDLDLFNIPTLVTHVPNPQPNDYARGYIKRYFIQKSNDDNSFIYEVSDDTYSQFNVTPFYKRQSLKWRLTGTDEEIKDSNYKSVKIAAENMKGLLLYLPNFLQFSQK